MIDFSARARAARIGKRWTQAQVGAAIGKSRPWVSLFEAGAIKRLSERDRRAITVALDLDRTKRPLVTMDEQALEELLVKAAEMGAERAFSRTRRAPTP
jgi:transcriptional regulator with XRE-family HTH domain